MYIIYISLALLAIGSLRKSMATNNLLPLAPSPTPSPIIDTVLQQSNRINLKTTNHEGHLLRLTQHTQQRRLQAHGFHPIHGGGQRDSIRRRRTCGHATRCGFVGGCCSGSSRFCIYTLRSLSIVIVQELTHVFLSF